MAPKQRKSILAQNPLQGSGSSSSSIPPIPSLFWFYDEKAKKDFFEIFQARGVHPKCQVILSNFSNTMLPDVIWTRGWESLCEKPVRCLVVFIQQFYFNIHGIDTPVHRFATRFRGTRIVVPLILLLRYYVSPGYCILTTLVVIVYGLCPETCLSLTFMRLLPYRVAS